MSLISSLARLLCLMARKLPPISKGDLAAQRHGAIMFDSRVPLNRGFDARTVVDDQSRPFAPVAHRFQSIVCVTKAPERVGQSDFDGVCAKHREASEPLMYASSIGARFPFDVLRREMVLAARDAPYAIDGRRER